MYKNHLLNEYATWRDKPDTLWCVVKDGRRKYREKTVLHIGDEFFMCSWQLFNYVEEFASTIL